MNPNGMWRVLESTDVLMPRGAQLEVQDGRFVVHNVVFGSFALDGSSKGISLEVKPFDVGLLARRYDVFVQSADRLNVRSARHAYVLTKETSFQRTPAR